MKLNSSKTRGFAETSFSRAILSLVVCVLCASISWSASTTLVPSGSAWKYYDLGTDLGVAWFNPDYDDSNWASGAAQLGYGDGDEATVVAYGPDPNSKYVTTYFRHAFFVADPGAYQSLALEVLRDDGAVVYLNGAEVARYGMPAGPITWLTYASGTSDYAWDAPQSIAGLLVTGRNVLAVEVHQGNASSSDLSFDLRLTGANEITIALDVPNSGAVGIPIPATFAATATHPNSQPMTVSFYGRPVPAPTADFSLVLLPDTQYYSGEINGGAAQMFFSQTSWVQANQAKWNIAYVAHVGDITENGDLDTDLSEWTIGTQAMYPLENPVLPFFPDGIPYGVAVGNHDQKSAADDLDPTTLFNQFFGVSHFQGRSWYGGHFGDNNNNHYQLFSASGLDFIAVYLEYDTSPDQAVLDWSDAVLKAYSNRRAIVASHYMLNNDGSFGAQGAAIYNALKANPNLFLMLCGHVPGEARRADVFNGSTNHTLMTDYQGGSNGGSGYLRILEFSPANNQIRVKKYSPYLDPNETTVQTQFTLDYSMATTAGFTLIQSVENVPSGFSAGAAWGALQQGADYEWFVSATDGVETRNSEIRRFTTFVEGAVPPVAPTGLIAAAQSNTEVLLTWTDNSDNETGFEVERSLDKVTWNSLGVLPPNTTFATDAGLYSGTPYYYRVRARNGSSFSAFSNIAGAAPYLDVYAFGETLLAGALSGSFANTLAADGSYERIDERLSGGRPASRFSTLEHTWTFNVTPGRSIQFLVQAFRTPSADGDSFRFSYSTDNITFLDMLMATKTVDDNTWQAFALPSTLSGIVYVRVQDADRTIGNTALDSLFVDHLLIRIDASPASSPPPAPVLRQALAGHQTVTLAWDAASGATSYRLWRAESSGPFVEIAAGLTVTSYVDSGLSNGTTYYYYVTGMNNCGEGSPSATLAAVPQAPVTISAPTSLAASAAKRKINLSWTQSASPGVTHNKIYRSADGRGNWQLLATVPATTVFSDTVPSGATFFYVVTAATSNLESSYSQAASATAK